MQNDTLQRLLGLIGKTGDRVVVTDPAGEKPYVLMSLDQYEKLLGEGNSPGTEAAKEPQSAPKTPSRPTLKVAEDIDPPVDLRSPRKKREIPLWKPSAPPKSTKGAGPAAEPEKEPASEEQFYLEPLE